MITTLQTTTPFLPAGPESSVPAVDPEHKSADDFAAMFASLILSPVMQPGFVPVDSASTTDAPIAAPVGSDGNCADAAVIDAVMPPLPQITMNVSFESLSPPANAQPSNRADVITNDATAPQIEASAANALPVFETGSGPIEMMIRPGAAQVLQTTPIALPVETPIVVDSRSAPKQSFTLPPLKEFTTLTAHTAQSEMEIADVNKQVAAASAPEIDAQIRPASAPLSQTEARAPLYDTGVAGELNFTEPNKSPLPSIKAGVGNSFDSQGNNSQTDSKPRLADMVAQPFAHSLAAVASEVAMKPEPPALQLTSHILALAENLVAPQTRSIRLRLHPEELGQVEIQLTRNVDGKVSAHLTTERETTKVALSQSLDQLRGTLERAGLTVDHLQVRASNGSLTNSKQNHDAPTPRTGSRFQNIDSSASADDADAARGREHKLLSLTA
jgi:flagellar hook-length control protein FliK